VVFAVIALMLSVFIFDSSRAYQRELDWLEGEEAALAGHVRHYEGLSDPEAWALFAARIEGRPAGTPRPLVGSGPVGQTAACCPYRPFPQPGDGAPAATKAAGLPPSIDLLLTYSTAGVAPGWPREFLPLLTLWLGEELGREPVIYDAHAGGLAVSLRLMRPSEALQRAKCGLMIITRRVLASPYGKEEIQRMLERFTSSGALVPVLLDRGEIDPALLGPLQKHQLAISANFRSSVKAAPLRPASSRGDGNSQIAPVTALHRTWQQPPSTKLRPEATNQIPFLARS
jgi:hypothetical protein